VGNVRVSILSGPLGSYLNADTVTGSPPCGGGGLACTFDGIGIAQSTRLGGDNSDDEVTLGNGETLRVSFLGGPVNINAIGFLDLFAPPQEFAETAGWTTNTAVTGSATQTYPALSSNSANGWLLAAGLGLTGVSFIDFFVPSGANGNSDFALASMEAAPVPIPAAFPLFVTGLAGLAALTRRRRKQAVRALGG
jgi:hypothetical protein